VKAFFSSALRLSIIPAALWLAACGSGDNSDDGSLSVIATLPLFADIAQNVAGDQAEVSSLLPGGADPHTFEPSPGDVARVAGADLVIANGLGLEPAAERVIDANLGDGAVLVELGEAALAAGAQEVHDDDDGHGEEGDDHEHEDVHLWLSPANGIIYAETIRDALIAADPAGRAAYEENFAAYAALLQETEAYMLATSAAVPDDQRLIIATHDAFGYLAEALNYQVAGFVVPGPGQDSSPGVLAGIVEDIQEFGIPAVFSEPQTDAESRTLEEIASDAGVQVCTLYSDAFGDEVTTYVDLLRFNAEELARCLGDA
jgi:ABC-type Zn uptake system ZnuABC Zn-binding protein ZnuA